MLHYGLKSMVIQGRLLSEEKKVLINKKSLTSKRMGIFLYFSTKCWSEHILSAYKATKDLKHPLYMTFKFLFPLLQPIII